MTATAKVQIRTAGVQTTSEPRSDELFRAWQAAKKAADEYEAEQNRTQSLRRGDPDADFRSEGGFYEIDLLREIERQAEIRYRAALEAENG